MKFNVRTFIEKFSEYIFLFLLAYMPFYVLLSTWAGTSTGYLDAIKASKEVLLVVGFLLALGTTRLSFIKKLAKDKLVWLIALYAALTVIMALVKPTDQDAEAIAVVYNLRFLLFFLYAGLLISRLNSDFIKKSIKIVLFSGVIVALFGIFQVTLLPNDALSNIGYSRENGTPAAFFISDETQAIERAYSTAKDPNSFGSYLIVVFSFSLLFLLSKWPRDRNLLGGITLAVLLCLFLTYSRSAWIGAAVALALILVLLPRTKRLILINKRRIIYFSLTLVVFILAGLFSFRNSSAVQNLVFHVGDDAKVTSNSGRTFALNYTVREVVDNPIGHGPGAAGPASFKNDVQGPVIPENYYLQIAYEVGVIGLAVFITVCGVIAKRLYVIRKIDYKAIALLASFAGLVVTNMLVHIWFFEPVAYTWWGIAGLVLYQNQTNPAVTKKQSKKLTKRKK